MKLELRGITKRFGALVANDHIDLTVESGEIHALLGENGAGKSTLMNVLYGLYTADEGEILLDGVVQRFAGPGDAMEAGIGMVHQHFMLIPVFTVAENVMLGHEETRFGGRLDLAGARERVREISARFGFDIDPDSLVENLPIGVQQRVEIVKALSRDAKVLVFDEPTAVLTPQETDEFMGVMRQLKEAGTSIVFITHKLREVREVADRITVIRLGKVVGEASPTSTTTELASMMVGRAVEFMVEKDPAKAGAVALSVDGLSVLDQRQHIVVDKVSFDVRAGEVLAIAGVQGNGQTELTEAIMGLQAKVTGSIDLYGESLRKRSVRGVLDAGVGFVPEDRTDDGLVADFTIAENLMLDRSNAAPFAKFGMLQLAYLADVRPGEDRGVRHPGPGHRRHGRPALGRQPAEGGPRPRTQQGAPAARRRAAHARTRRRLGRVRPHAHHRGEGRRRRRHRRLHRTRRGQRPRRPHRGDVPRGDRRNRSGGHPARGPRPHDGGGANRTGRGRGMSQQREDATPATQAHDPAGGVALAARPAGDPRAGTRS